MSATPRHIPDIECKQGKCAQTSTGCWGECSLKHYPAYVVATGTISISAPLPVILAPTDTPVANPYGTLVFENESYVIRVREKDGELTISGHRKNSAGQEEIPRGYMLGSNMLIMEKKNA